MGISFWILFIIQVAVALALYRIIFKVESESPTEAITPATEDDIEVL